MKAERYYTTREVAEMWNVSPSTIKRWADSESLKCHRTPGGHRKFSMRDISEFQARQGFEATGLLSTEDWEDPEIEVAVNQKKYNRLCREVLKLGLQNQRSRVEHFLQRLHIRGLDVWDLYDQIIIPTLKEARQPSATENGEASDGHLRLLINNLDEAVHLLIPHVSRKRPNGKIALCGSLGYRSRLQVNALSRILEIEGWDAYNVGNGITFELLADLVKREPIELVCIACLRLDDLDRARQSFDALCEATQPYRIPILLTGKAFSSKKVRKRFPHDAYVKNFRSFRRQAVSRSSD